MNFDQNRIPTKLRKIHLIATCGTGMGALACMLNDMGFDVTGSDLNVYPPMSDFLAQKGITVTQGFKPEHLDYGPDLVVVGNAVTPANPEAIHLQQLDLPFCSMPQAINWFVADGKKLLVATGTHGKTTTSSLWAWVLHTAGLDPSFIIGGILKNFDSNYRLGRGDYVVLEGDEYDSAFFNKVPKIWHYSPHQTILTSVEFDHADIFKDLDHVKQAFDTFVSAVRPGCQLIAYDDDANLDAVLAGKNCRIERYGARPASPWRLGDFRIEPPHLYFEVFKHNRHFGEFKSGLTGRHNLFNTLAVIAAADALAIPATTIAEALATFQSVKRRQEIRGEKNGITVIDDFAHHPTAVKETIQALKPFCNSGRLIAVFEPRTNSSRRKVFQDVYPLSFDAADLICIRKPPMLNNIPAEQRFSSDQLVADLRSRQLAAHCFDDTDGIIDHVVGTARPGDTILVMSNGGFDNIHQRLLDRL